MFYSSILMKEQSEIELMFLSGEQKIEAYGDVLGVESANTTDISLTAVSVSTAHVLHRFRHSIPSCKISIVGRVEAVSHTMKYVSSFIYCFPTWLVMYIAFGSDNKYWLFQENLSSFR